MGRDGLLGLRLGLLHPFCNALAGTLLAPYQVGHAVPGMDPFEVNLVVPRDLGHRLHVEVHKPDLVVEPCTCAWIEKRILLISRKGGGSGCLSAIRAAAAAILKAPKGEHYAAVLSRLGNHVVTQHPDFLGLWQISEGSEDSLLLRKRILSGGDAKGTLAVRGVPVGLTDPTHPRVAATCVPAGKRVFVELP